MLCRLSTFWESCPWFRLETLEPSPLRTLRGIRRIMMPFGRSITQAVGLTPRLDVGTEPGCAITVVAYECVGLGMVSRHVRHVRPVRLAWCAGTECKALGARLLLDLRGMKCSIRGPGSTRALSSSSLTS